jgi:hypothetical protein
VSLRRTHGWDRRSSAGPAAELRRRIHDDGGKAARSRPTRPASPTSAALEASSVRKHVQKELTSAQTASLGFWYVSDSISFLQIESLQVGIQSSMGR